MKILLPLIAFVLPAALAAQTTTYDRQIIVSEKVEVVNPRDVQPDFYARITNLEAPSPDGESYRSFLMRQKIESASRYPAKENATITHKTSALEPIAGRGKRKRERLFNGNMQDVVGGIPNDNTLAVSNDGIVLSAINSWLWAYDSKTDTVIFPEFVKNLKVFGGGGIAANDFDPKLIYDPAADRFIMVFLLNNTPASSSLRICFSSTNNPLDPWYRYALPGNPLNNNRWSDFPAISVTDDELFFTINLIIPNVSWQVGFDGSVIWQIDKHAGFAGDSVITNTLWSDIRHDGRLIRNLHPVQGATGNAGSAFFLSNRNFDIVNDTMFVLNINGVQSNPNTALSIKAVPTDTPYGVPPNGRQADTDVNDPTSGLQTNDARVLGAITNGEWIQFVGNTKNFNTGFSAIYHGFVEDIFENPRITGTVVGHPTRDYGYPNIAFAGAQNCDIQTMIGFNYTSPTDFPGVGALYFGNDGTYSNPIDLKAGENYTDRHAQTYERWGDYTGIQPKFNEPGTIWMNGYFGNTNKSNVTWIAEIFSPDTTRLRAIPTIVGHPSLCNAGVEITVDGGTPPFLFSYNGGNFTSNASYTGLCEEQAVEVVVVDASGCEVKQTIYVSKTITANPPTLFPNPAGERMVLQFTLPDEQNLTVYIADQSGRVVAEIIKSMGMAGMNELVFYTAPLAKGTYFLRVEGDKGYSYKEKFIRL